MNYPISENFFRANFHQDWNLDFLDWREVVLDYYKSMPLDVLNSLVLELDHLSEIYPESTLRELLYSHFSAYYDPMDNDLTATEWLEIIKNEIASYIKKASAGGLGQLPQ